MGRILKLHIFNRSSLSGQVECSAGDGLFVNGDYLFPCPNCKTYCHIDCWSTYKSNCPRCSFHVDAKSFWDDLVATQEDKLWILFAYIFSPFVPPILMIMDDKRDRPFIIAHVFQAFIIGLIGILMWLFCLGILVWFYQIYLGLQAYQGNNVRIPLITNLCKELGWV